MPNYTKTNQSNVEKGIPRLAFSLQETSQMLGISYMTVFRLLKRGKLLSCGELRTKLITKTEIERYLRETQKAWKPRKNKKDS